jgi:cysteine-S-conjugate beta-lyase
MDQTPHYDFETVIDRRNTSCLKWDASRIFGHGEDELPLWVADMDFRTVPEAIEALTEKVKFGIYGYSLAPKEYYDAVASWFEKHHGWRPERSWAIHTPGVVFALATAIRSYTQPGDAIVVQPPVYYPFRLMIQENGRRMVINPLRYEQGSYTMDFEGFERTLKETGAKLFILCNPHNPVGRAWTEEELRRIGEICLANDVLVVSDEIHADFARPGHKHVSFATLGNRFANNAVVCTSPSKTFNLAGLQISNIFIPNKTLHDAFKRTLSRTGYDEPSMVGAVAAQACYEHGEEWLRQLKAKLNQNYQVLEQAISEIQGMHLVPLESTYLPWIDCNGLGMSDAELKEFVEKKAKLWLDLGTMFGKEGSGFIRMNLATPTANIEEACSRLANAAAQL